MKTHVIILLGLSLVGCSVERTDDEPWLNQVYPPSLLDKGPCPDDNLCVFAIYCDARGMVDYPDTCAGQPNACLHYKVKDGLDCDLPQAAGVGKCLAGQCVKP